MIVAGVEVGLAVHHYGDGPAALARLDDADVGAYAGHAAALGAAAVILFDAELFGVLATRQGGGDHRAVLLAAQGPVDLIVVRGRAAALAPVDGTEQRGKVVGARQRQVRAEGIEGDVAAHLRLFQ